MSAALAGWLLAFGAAPVLADDDPDCSGFDRLGEQPGLRTATVSGTDHAFFVRNPGKDQTCPNGTPQCRDAAYLVSGDRVLVSRTRGAFSCVDYLGRTGTVRSGWIASTSLAPEPAAPLTAADWRGHWTAIESQIDIRGGPAGRLAVAGYATYGSLDPERVKIGAVNVGEFKAAVAPEANALAFTVGDNDETLPVTKGDQYACRVWMRRLGPWLVADDNNQCGGLNVSFRGIYRHKS